MRDTKTILFLTTKPATEISISKTLCSEECAASRQGNRGLYFAFYQRDEFMSKCTKATFKLHVLSLCAMARFTTFQHDDNNAGRPGRYQFKLQFN